MVRSAGGIVLNKLQIFKNAGYFELSLQQPLSLGFAVTAPLTQGSLEAVHDGLFQQTERLCRCTAAFVVLVVCDFWVGVSVIESLHTCR